jgi:hypothetical protein
MATRYICDQCGNEVTPQALIRFRVEEINGYNQGGGVPGLYGGSSGQQLSAAQAMANIANIQNPNKVVHGFTVELCPTCSSTWLSRVMNLTQRSNR